MFQHEPAFGLQVLWRRPNDATDVVEAVRPRSQCTARLETQVTPCKMRIVIGDVRRVADDDVELCRIQLCEPVTLQEADIVEMQALAEATVRAAAEASTATISACGRWLAMASAMAPVPVPRSSTLKGRRVSASLSALIAALRCSIGRDT